eukprot:6212483-Pleurochrysis_carterae.AAC.3
MRGQGTRDAVLLSNTGQRAAVDPALSAARAAEQKHDAALGDGGQSPRALCLLLNAVHFVRRRGRLRIGNTGAYSMYNSKGLH